MFLDEKDMNMDTLLNCLAVACVAVLVNRSEDILFSLSKILLTVLMKRHLGPYGPFFG